MELKELADELRAGFAWRYADGPVVMSAAKKEKVNADDWTLLKAAATCHACRRSATNDEINEAVAEAEELDAFSEIIAEKIEHALDCAAGV